MNQEDEERMLASIRNNVEQIPPSMRAGTLHCMNELRRMVELEKIPAMHAIVLFGKALSDARLVSHRVLIVPGGHKK